LKLNGESVVKQSELVALQQQLSTALARIQALESKPTTTVVSEKNTARGSPASVTCKTGVVVNCLNRSQSVREMQACLFHLSYLLLLSKFCGFSFVCCFVCYCVVLYISCSTDRWKDLSM
jgi:hypothetical protein